MRSDLLSSVGNSLLAYVQQRPISACSHEIGAGNLRDQMRNSVNFEQEFLTTTDLGSLPYEVLVDHRRCFSRALVESLLNQGPEHISHFLQRLVIHKSHESARKLIGDTLKLDPYSDASTLMQLWTLGHKEFALLALGGLTGPAVNMQLRILGRMKKIFSK